jgi:hypothetical protein
VWRRSAKCGCRVAMFVLVEDKSEKLKQMRKKLLALSRQAQTAAIANVPRLLCTASLYAIFHSPQSSSNAVQRVRNMNWTGGSLQRTKKANAGVLQQQKAYFAKSRTHLQNASNSPVAPFRPSYLRDNEGFDLMPVGAIHSFGSVSVRHTGHSAKRRGERPRREPSPGDRRSAIGYNELSKRRRFLIQVAHRPSSRPGAQKRTHEGRFDDVLPTWLR